jgi:very-short-patch-repair endonuclease
MSAASEPNILERQRALLMWMDMRHGVAHSSDVRAAGFRGAEIARAVTAGDLIRVRRSWLVNQACDPGRRAAAAVGGRLTCVSAAAERGLWVPAHEHLHIAVAGTSSRHDDTGLRLHWGTGPAPIGRNTSEDPILNVLFHTAQCLPRTDALAVWESAIRKKLVDPLILSRVAWRRADAAAIATVSSALSDSGLETHFVSGMLRAGVVVEQQVWLDGHPVDGLIGKHLVIQLDGFAHHSSVEARRRDIEADARLVLRGYTVLRFDFYQVLFQWEQVRDAVLTAIAQRAHR